MGQRWSMLKNGYKEESESEGDSESLAQLRQSQATTEASSSGPAFDNRGLCSTCPNDIELSSLQSGEATRDTRRGTKPTLSMSHISSVNGSLEDSKSSCRLRPRKSALDYKVEAYRQALHGQFAIRKLGANAGAAVPSTSPVPSLTPDVAKLMELTQTDAGEVEMLHSPTNLQGHVKVGGKRTLQQSTVSQPPFSPAQTLLMFQLDPKRKRPARLPSLAFDCACFPATHVKLKARTPLERPSEGAVAGEAVLDLGTGEGMVGRSVKQVVEGQRECRRGHVSCYNAAQRLYQIKYDNGEEEALEWLDLEPHLITRGRARTRPRYRTVDELVYTKAKTPGRQGRRRRLVK